MKLLDRVRHRAKASPTPEEIREQEIKESGRKPSSPAAADAQAKSIPGGEAEKPQQIPPKGWLDVFKRGWKEAKDDNVPLLAAGVAYYAFLAIFPAIIALVLIYGLVANPSTVQHQINSLSTAIPSGARELLTDQMKSLASKSNQGLGWGVVVSVLVSLWSASNGAGNLMKAINVAYDEKDTRNFVKQKALSLLVTAGAIVFVVLAILLLAALPPVLKSLDLSAGATFLVQVVRWALLLASVVVALAILYRIAPDRDAPKFRWTSVGAVVATLLWIAGSIGFSLYTSQGGYGSSYGLQAGVVVLLTWLWLTSYAILLGAEINAESEQQTVKDTTKGESEPIGTRGAVKADTLAA